MKPSRANNPMKTCIAIVIAVLLGSAMYLRAGAESGQSTIYDPDPHHLWNRLNKTLFLRTAADGKQYGLDELDILYWYRTTNLLSGASHQRALNILDEFIQSHGEKLINDPFKHALLQRDLWALFDWTVDSPPTSYAAQQKELQNRLALVIRRLALTTNEIASLPDNYALTDRTNAPDLPHGLFATNGDWVNLAPDQGGYQEIAPLHDHNFAGHSVFLAMVRFPQGRVATLAYLDQLHLFEHFWVYVTNTVPLLKYNPPHEILAVNDQLPQFPTNTEWALVRRMVVIDADGNIRLTPITESIQLRRYLGFSPPVSQMVTNDDGSKFPIQIPPQKFFEFQMNRRENGRLRQIANDERDFLNVHFMSIGFDPFEMTMNEKPVRDSSKFTTRVLYSCSTCHLPAGIYSVNVYAGLFHPATIAFPQLYSSDVNDVTRTAIGWKQGQFSWGLLQGLWRQAD
jgi:hypothetical protein